MPYPPDPGGNFASDAHRRVVMAVPAHDDDTVSDSIDAIQARVDFDDQNNLDADEVNEILSDLEADGDVEQVEGGWRLTEQGSEVGAGNNAWNGGREYGVTA